MRTFTEAEARAATVMLYTALQYSTRTIGRALLTKPLTKSQLEVVAQNQSTAMNWITSDCEPKERIAAMDGMISFFAEEIERLGQ